MDVTVFAVFVICLWLMGKVCLWTSFPVPSLSMSPTIQAGDRVFVWKPWMGARLFNLLDAINGKEPQIYRCPGFRSVRRNDILVFNYPYSEGWNQLSFDIMHYYVKRCVALPGDTFFIRNGLYKVSGFSLVLGNRVEQLKFSRQDEQMLKEQHKWSTYPNDTLFNWNVKDMGPLFIPKKGSTIHLNTAQVTLYKSLIEWESGQLLQKRPEGTGYKLGGKPITHYRFQHDYYFMVGDYVEASEDSRYWGLVPDTYIVGIVAYIQRNSS